MEKQQQVNQKKFLNFGNKNKRYGMKKNIASFGFSGTDSITEILHKNLTDEDNAKFSEDKLEEYLDFDIDLDEHINKQYIKLRILSEKAKSSILFMDDTDKLTGKKLEIAKELLRNSKNFIITATDEHTINKTIIGYQL